jgi:hypothetical protein
MTDSTTKTITFIAQIKTKIDNLLAEFASGKLNREQFHAVYEHYTSQLQFAEQALSAGSTLANNNDPKTIAIMASRMGKAVGVVIYNNRSGTTVDTLGDFDVPPSRVSSVLNDFTMMMESGRATEHRIEKVDGTHWLLFVGGQYTTIVTLFRNEPSLQQAREMERLHRDFESANQHHFKVAQFDSNKLAYPFLVFIQRKLKQS